MKLLGKLLLTALLLTLPIGSALADPIYLDIGSYADGTGGTGDANTVTDLFEQMQFYAHTSTEQYGTIDPNTQAPAVGSTFIDQGHFEITSYVNISSPGDDEGLGTNGQTGEAYALTGEWSGLTGQVTGSYPVGPNFVQTVEYNPGTLMYFYIDDDVDQTFGPGNTLDFSDDAGFGADPGTTLIGTLEITGGTGTNTFDNSGNFLSGSSQLSGTFTQLADDFWYTAAGDDIYDTYFVQIGWTFNADIDQNSDNLEILPGGGGANDPLFTVLSDHDGSIDFNVVPEPATMLLLGSGLLGMVGLRRRKEQC